MVWWDLLMPRVQHSSTRGLWHGWRPAARAEMKVCLDSRTGVKSPQRKCSYWKELTSCSWLHCLSGAAHPSSPRGPRHSESENVSPLDMSSSLQPHGLEPIRLLCSWDSPGKNTGVGCHCSPGDLPDPGIKPRSPALQADSLLSEPSGKPTSKGLKIHCYVRTRNLCKIYLPCSGVHVS